jgi:16S rRNA (guanine966-N2)-methyltransferase
MMSERQTPEFRFTIIAGELKGKKITAPDLGVTRPPLSRLRKSIFDFLRPYLADAAYLDLFSGTGSYLFEAVSRGVANAVGVETETELVRAIFRQAEKFGVADRLHCRQQDVFSAIPRLAAEGNRFNIIMVAPPQYQGLIDQTLDAIKEHRIISPGGLIVCQHASSKSDTPNFAGYPVQQRRKYGNTTFTVFVAE